jgi:hypothetical protein
MGRVVQRQEVHTESSTFKRGYEDGRANRPYSPGPLRDEFVPDYQAGYERGHAEARNGQPPPAQPALATSAEDGLIATGQVLQSVAAPEGEYLRKMYNAGAQQIAEQRVALKAEVDAGRMTEERMAQILSDARHELALRVRRTGSALYRPRQRGAPDLQGAARGGQDRRADH